MSADPFIQAPTNSQSLNRYTYVINNPLSLTDPSGFISIGDVFKIAIAVAAVYFLGPLGQYALVTEAAAGSVFAAGLANSAIAGFVSGLALSGGNLKAGFIGGLSGAAFYGVGHSAGMDGFFSSLGGGEEFARVVAHGVVGGVSGELQGGDFLSGFMAAGFTKAAVGINGLFENVDGPSLGNTIKAAVLGGTASVIGGDKFANGAATAAMGYLFGSLARSSSVRTGGRVLSPEQAKAALNDIKDSLGVDPQALLEGANGVIKYDPVNIVRIYDALDRLATVQGESFLQSSLFGPERTMLARVMLGKGDNYTVAWFHHESAEAIFLADSRHLPSSQYLAAQELAHKQVLHYQGNSSINLYHPSVVRAYDRQFGTAYPRY